jgi:hypothetical protein
MVLRFCGGGIGHSKHNNVTNDQNVNVDPEEQADDCVECDLDEVGEDHGKDDGDMDDAAEREDDLNVDEVDGQDDEDMDDCDSDDPLESDSDSGGVASGDDEEDSESDVDFGPEDGDCDNWDDNGFDAL